MKHALGFLVVMAIMAVLVPSQTLAQAPHGEIGRWSSSGPAGHAPIGVMGDHTHHAGEWMLNYMFTRETRSALRDGRARISPDDAYAMWPMVPLDMTMDMHMGHVMYAPWDRVTLMGMFMWMDHQMDARMANSLMPGHGNGHEGHGRHGFTLARDWAGMNGGHGHEHGPDAPSHTHAHGVSGWADSEVAALVTVLDRDRRRVHLNLGVGIPTGSIDAEDDRMAGSGHERMPYPMQLGSGSWEARSGATFLQQTDRLSLGAQGLGSLPLNDNDAGYRWGNAVTLNGWTQLRGSDWIAPGVRLQSRVWGDLSGTDPNLDPMVSPENDPDRQGGSRLSGYLSLNFQVPSGMLQGHRVALEWGGAMAESLNGPQMGEDWTFNLGWEYAF